MINTKIRKIHLAILLAIVTASNLSGCNGTTGANLGTLAGAGLGAYGGTVLGKKIGGTSGEVVGGILGAGFGGLIGNQIGQYLDPAEKKQASIATQQALNNPKVGSESTTTWTSPTNPNTSGGTTVTEKVVTMDGRVCKNATSYAKVKGKDVKETETYCRDSQTGGWILEA